MSAPIPDEQAALLAAIVAEPDEDTPRLVYADWLQENGDEEQAEFIRDSIKLDHFEDHEDDQCEKIADRVDKLATSNNAHWLKAIGITATGFVYDRGMPEGIAYDAGWFVGEAANLFARVPVRNLAISDDWALTSGTTVTGLDSLMVLAGMPQLARLRTLSFSNDLNSISISSWLDLIGSPHIAPLQKLSILEAELNDEYMRFVDLFALLPNLEELDLTGNRITVAGALSVVRSSRLPKLRRLSLVNNRIVEDRSPGSLYLELEDALYERFEGLHPLSESL